MSYDFWDNVMVYWLEQSSTEGNDSGLYKSRSIAYKSPYIRKSKEKEHEHKDRIIQ